MKKHNRTRQRQIKASGRVQGKRLKYSNEEKPKERVPRYASDVVTRLRKFCLPGVVASTADRMLRIANHRFEGDVLEDLRAQLMVGHRRITFRLFMVEGESLETGGAELFSLSVTHGPCEGTEAFVLRSYLYGGPDAVSVPLTPSVLRKVAEITYWAQLKLAKLRDSSSDAELWRDNSYLDLVPCVG